MTTPLRQLLAQYRATAKTEREKGNYFERLAVSFLKSDPGMGQEYEDAWLFSDWAKARGLDGRDTGIDAVAGRRLGDLHCDFDSADLYPVTFERGDTGLAPPADPVGFYRVEKMKHGGKRPNVDKTTIIYNANITVTDIPLEAYDYVVNGKSAIDWVIERQCVKTDKASGIVNDANRFAIETMNDPAYPLKLLQRVITVSLETMKIVRGLPKLEIA